MFGKKRAAETRTGADASAADFEVVASVQTDKGCVREINEDSGRMVRPADPRLLAEKGTLVVVADGMGGHSAGERLIALAKERGGHDNITVGILAIMPGGAAAAEADDVPATRELEAI